MTSAVPETVFEHHLSPAHPFWMGMCERQPPSPATLHVHSGLEVGLTLAGHYEFEFGGHVREVGPGAAALCAMWEPHRASLLDPEGNSGLAIVFLPEFLASDPRDAAPWMRLFAADPAHRPRVESEGARHRLLEIGRHLCEELSEQSQGWEEMVRLQLLSLLLILAREWQAPPLTSVEQDARAGALARVTPAVALVHRDLSHRVSCLEAATACGFSEPHFRALFRAVMGIGFGWFSLRARLGFAAHYLSSTGRPLQQIVESAGFADLSHLRRVFEKHFGCSPAEYRRRARSTPPPISRAASGGNQRTTDWGTGRSVTVISRQSG
jgi:AraC-like DNA-binding protein